MTLEEAIKHAEEKVKCGGKCGEDHAQLAGWLKELRERRVAEPEKRTEKRTETHACDSISRRAAIEALIRKIRPHNNGDGTITMWVMSEELVRETLNEVPSAQPERKTGRWIDAVIPNDNGGLPVQVCDQCNTFFPLAYTGGGHRYCPNCGAYMGATGGENDV